MADPYCLVVNRQTGELRLAYRSEINTLRASGWFLVVAEPDIDLAKAASAEETRFVERIAVKTSCAHQERLATCPPSQTVIECDRPLDLWFTSDLLHVIYRACEVACLTTGQPLRIEIVRTSEPHDEVMLRLHTRDGNDWGPHAAFVTLRVLPAAALGGLLACLPEFSLHSWAVPFPGDHGYPSRS